MSGQCWPNAILEREWLALRWHMQGLLGYGRWTNIETNGWQLRWPDEQNDIMLTSFVDVGPTKLPTKCQRWSNKWLLSGLEHVEFHIRQSIVICLLLRTHMMYLCDFFLNFNVFLPINSISSVAFRKFTKTHQWSSAILDQHHYYGILPFTPAGLLRWSKRMNKSQETVTYIQPTSNSRSAKAHQTCHFE